MHGDHERAHDATTGQPTVWLVVASDRQEFLLEAFWERADAAARVALLNGDDPVGVTLLREVAVLGGRQRCQLCGEPVVLDDPSDPMSWIHAADANDLGDHTAEA